MKFVIAVFLVLLDVVVKMIILFFKLCFLAVVVIKYGKIDKVIFLKVIVEL